MKQILQTLIFIIVVILTGFFISNKYFLDQEDKNVFVVGLDTGFVPYEMINDSGEIIGFDVDVAKALAKKLGKKLVVKDLNFDGLVLSVQQGRIDAIISGMSITPKRLEVMNMVHYHGKGVTKLPLIFWQTIPEGITSMNDLQKLDNPIVAVQAGSIQDTFVSGFDFVQPLYLDKTVDLISAIKYNKALACVIEPYVVNSLQEQHPQLVYVDVELNPEQKTFGHGIGVNKSNVELTKQVERAIEELKSDGTLDQLQQRWFK